MIINIYAPVKYALSFARTRFYYNLYTQKNVYFASLADFTRKGNACVQCELNVFVY